MSKKLFRIDGRVIASVTVVLVLFLMVVFRHHMFRFGVEKYLSAKYKVEGGWGFSYDTVGLESDRLIFRDVNLQTRQGNIDCHIEKVDLVLRSFSGIPLDIGLDLQSPVVTMKKGEHEKGIAIQDLLKSPLGRIKVDVDQGVCRLIEGEEVTEVFFSFISNEKQRSLGAFYLSNRPNIRESANLMVKPYQWPQEFISEFEMQDVDIQWLSKVWQFFQPKNERAWAIREGVLDGRLWLGLTYEGKLNQATASISLSQLDASMEADGLSFAAKELDCDFSYPGTKKAVTDVDIWWQNSVLKSKVEGGHLHFADPHTRVEFAIRDILGEVNFSSFTDSEINLRGLLDHNGQISPIVLDGNPSVVDKETLDIDMKVFLEPDSNCSTHLNLSLSVGEESQYIVRGKLKDMGVDQVAMLQHMIGFSLPEVKDFQLQNGMVNCELSLLFRDGRAEKLLLDNLVANELQVYWLSRDILGVCSSVSGSAQLDFNGLPKFRFPSWEVNLQSGDLVIGRKTAEPIGVSDINMQLFMCRDVFEPSWIKATYDGVEIGADILGYYAEADVKLHLRATGDRLFQFYSKEMNGIEHFHDHRLNVNLELRRRLGYWDMAGNVEMDVKGDWIDQARFGCQLSDKIMQYRSGNVLSLLHQSISKGWFKADSLSCEFMKFINHSEQNGALLEGIVSIEGTFDSKEIDFDVRTQYMNLFSPHLDVRLHGSLDPSNVTTSEGKFHYDAIKGRWSGFFPFYRAAVTEKQLGLQFYETKGDLYIEGSLLKLNALRCESEGLELEGEVTLDLSAPDGIVLKGVANRILGTVQQAESFLHHIESCKGLTFPFEGRLNGTQESLSFFFDGTKKEPVIVWEAHFKVMHAQYSVYDGLLLRDLEFDLDSNSEDQETRISNLKGRLPSSYYENGYTVNGKNIEIIHADGIQKIQFDLRLENQVMDLIRLSGTYEKEKRLIELQEENSHFFGISMKGTKFFLDESNRPESVDCTFTIPIDELFQYQVFLTDFGFLGQENSPAYHPFYQAKGLVEGRLSLENTLWKWQLEGSDLEWNQSICHHFYLEGEKRNEGYFIADCSLDDLHLMGDVVYGNEGYLLENMVVSTLKSTAHFKPGTINFTTKLAELPIEQATIDISEFSPFEGILDAKGDVAIDFGTKNLDRLILANLVVECSDIANTGMKVTTPKPLNVTYGPESGMILSDSNFSIRKGGVIFTVVVPNLRVVPKEGITEGYRIGVNATDEAIDYLEKLEVVKVLDPNLALPRHKSGITSFLCDFEISPDNFVIGGIVDRGTYEWRGVDYSIVGLTFRYDRKHLDFYVQAPFMGQEFGVDVRILPFDQYETTVEAFQLANGEIVDREKRALWMDCSLKGVDGISIKRMEGNAFGLDFQFLPEQRIHDDDALPFLGSIKIDAEKVLPLCGPELTQLIQEMKLKKGYELRGELMILKDRWKDSYFEGYLQGKDFDLLGYQFKTFLSSIRCGSQSVYIRDMKIIDDSVAVDISEINMTVLPNTDWRVSIPNLVISDLRPSLLKRRYQTYQRLKPFHIKQMVFTDVVGSMNDMTTFTGKGHMNFINTFKQGHNLLDIPLEIISRLGLDMTLLVPIQGEIDYVLKDGKVVFTKLKNSFSESKRSYFYLWNKSESYVDFAGNMNIDIRMKQYVLLKFTELFVLSIHGTLEEPRVSLK